jgi:hypothetical protein
MSEKRDGSRDMAMHSTVKLCAFAVALFGLGACNELGPVKPEASSSVAAPSSSIVAGDLGFLTYVAVDRMLDQGPSVTTETPLAVATIADVQDLGTTTPLGNIIADIVRNRLVQRGMTVHEIRLRSTVLIEQGQGELVLGRNRRDLVPPPNTAALVTGTYAVASDRVYVSLKIISRADAQIISGADFVVMLRRSGVDGLLHRQDASNRNSRN